MNEILLLAIGSGFTAIGALLCGLVLHALRGFRDRFSDLEEKITKVDAKANESIQHISYLRGRSGELGPIRDWRE